MFNPNSGAFSFHPTEQMECSLLYTNGINVCPSQLNHNKATHKLKHYPFSIQYSIRKLIASSQHNQNIDFQTAINLQMHRAQCTLHIYTYLVFGVTKCSGFALNFHLIRLNIILTLVDINCYAEKLIVFFPVC